MDGDSDVVLVSGEPFVARVGDAGVAVGGSEVYCGSVCLSTGLCGGECQCAAEGLRGNYQRIGYGITPDYEKNNATYDYFSGRYLDGL